MMKLFRASNKEVEASKRKRRQLELLIRMIGAVSGIIAQFGVFLFGAYLALHTQTITAGAVIILCTADEFCDKPHRRSTADFSEPQGSIGTG